MSVTAIAAFWGVSLLFVLTPGADWAYAITAGLRDRSVLPAVAGLLAGHLGATLVVAAGVATLVAGNPLVLTALTAVGSAYLLWLGVAMLRSPGAIPSAVPVPAPGAVPVTVPSSNGGAGPTDEPQDQTMSQTPWPRRVVKGAGVSGLNPKVFLLFLALLPQFTDPDAAWPLAVQIITLGLVHITSCAVVYLAVGLAARRVLRTRPSATRIVTRISGAAMIVIAAVLLTEQLFQHLHT